MARLIVGLAGAGLVAWFLLRRVNTVTSSDDEPSQDTAPDFLSFNPFDQIKDMIAPTDTDQADANTAAFLAMIRKAEGTAGQNGYRTLFGGRLFSDFSDHPRIAKQFTDREGNLRWTSAAGAYQFMAVSPIPGSDRSTKVNTWDRIAARLGLPDFSPESQDLAAIELIREAGALGDVRAGRFDQAVGKVRGIWASMPGAGYNQPEKSLDALRVAYLQAGGNLA